MSEQMKQLQDLEAQLHEVDEEFARAAQPLFRMTNLNDEQRKQLGVQLRAIQARWESVTQQISRVLGVNGATGAAGGQMTKANTQ